MNPRTTETLNALRRVAWFRSVGSVRGEHIIAVADWDEALGSSDDGTWENVQLEAANQVSLAVLRQSRERFQRWNDIVAVVKPVVTDLVDEKVRDVVARENLETSTFVASVRWDILHLALEAEFSDLIAPGFFAQLGYWYEKGHWPCGWEGSMDSGRLVVF